MLGFTIEEIEPPQNIDRFLIQLNKADRFSKNKVVKRNIDRINETLKKVPFSTRVDFIGPYTWDDSITTISTSMDNALTGGVVFGARSSDKAFTKAFGDNSGAAGFSASHLSPEQRNFLTKNVIKPSMRQAPHQAIFLNTASLKDVPDASTRLVKTLLHEIGHSVTDTDYVRLGRVTSDDARITKAKTTLNEILLNNNPSATQIHALRSSMKDAISGYALEEIRAEQFAYENINRLIKSGEEFGLDSLRPSYLAVNSWDHYLQNIFDSMGPEAAKLASKVDPHLNNIVRSHAIGLMHGGFKMISGEAGEHAGRQADSVVLDLLKRAKEAPGMNEEDFQTLRQTMKEASEEVQSKGFKTVLSDPIVGEISSRPIRPRIPVAASPASSPSRILGRQSSDLIEVASGASRAVASGTSGSRALRVAGAALSILRRKV